MYQHSGVKKGVETLKDTIQQAPEQSQAPSAPLTAGRYAPPGTGAGAAPAALPCLSINNSNGNDEKKRNSRATYLKKSADSLRQNVEEFFKIVPLENLGFLTLTFPDNIKDPREAQRRFNSFWTGVGSSNFGAYIRVKERDQGDKLHFHLLVNCLGDIRTGFDHVSHQAAKKEAAQHGYSTPLFKLLTRQYAASATPLLRQLWSRLRDSLPSYNLGRHELEPIRTNKEAMSCYVGKYISKEIKSSGNPLDKGFRTVCYSAKGHWKRATMQRQWITPRAMLWRYKVGVFATLVVGVQSYDALKDTLGDRWAYYNREKIMALPLGPDAPFMVKAAQQYLDTFEAAKATAIEKRRALTSACPRIPSGVGPERDLQDAAWETYLAALRSVTEALGAAENDLKHAWSVLNKEWGKS